MDWTYQRKSADEFLLLGTEHLMVGWFGWIAGSSTWKIEHRKTKSNKEDEKTIHTVICVSLNLMS